MTDIGSRKRDHLELCATGAVEHVRSTLLEEVHLLHDALPEASLDEVDLSVELFGRRMQAPILIAGMTGGTPEAAALNRSLATAAQKLGLGMGVGSQRAMLIRPECAETFQVRDVAPDIPLLANIGAVQARDAGPERVLELARQIGADALCVHLNVAQELVQSEGDRDFRGCLRALRGLSERARSAGMTVVAKETGCGLSPGALARLAESGVQWVDVSGAGGTSWTGVESLRGTAKQRALGAELHDWGIPTAASIAYARRAGLGVIASGGIRSGLDVARAVALGAQVAALALPFLRSLRTGGEAQLMETGALLVETLRSVTLLCGARNASELRAAPRVLGPTLRGWIGD